MFHLCIHGMLMSLPVIADRGRGISSGIYFHLAVLPHWKKLGLSEIWRGVLKPGQLTKPLEQKINIYIWFS